MTQTSPQQISLQNRYATAASSLARFSARGLMDAADRARARNREIRNQRPLTPADMTYLRAALDQLEAMGWTYDATTLTYSQVRP